MMLQGMPNMTASDKKFRRLTGGISEEKPSK